LGPHGEESSPIGPPEILRHPYALINAHRPLSGEAGCARSLSGSREKVTAAAATGVRLSSTSLQELSGLADQWENSIRRTNRTGDPVVGVGDNYGVRRGSCTLGNAVTPPPVFYSVRRPPPMEEQRWDLLRSGLGCAAQPIVSNQVDRTTGSLSTTDV
jgi:hypothetical protein